MKKMLVRWLGAYGKGSTLADALSYELTAVTREVAAELILSYSGAGYRSALKSDRVKIGLEVEVTAFRRGFVGDAWTRVEGDRLLQSYRKPIKDLDRLVKARIAHHKMCNSEGWVSSADRYAECVCVPHYTAIIIAGSITAQAQAVIEEIAMRHQMEVKYIDV